MGKKKKFFDKKKSATFQLMARDTSDPDYSSGPSGDRVFVRVDNNQYTPEGLDEDPDSIFADAPEDCDDEDTINVGEGLYNRSSQTTGLPDHIRSEILELGFPDDGYNYLTHLREIKNTGGGSAYYQNPKADLNQLPLDVKAYDASRLEVSKLNETSEEKLMYNVASKTVGVRLQKVVDPEVAAMLDDSDLSGSDIEDLEEDFIVRANHLEGSAAKEVNEALSSTAVPRSDHVQGQDSVEACVSVTTDLDSEKRRAYRPLDEQFDMLELNEYGTDSEDEYNRYMDADEREESLAEKLDHAFKNNLSIQLQNKMKGDDNESPEVTAEVVRRCREYAEKYEDEDYDDLEEVLVGESSDESEAFDCETIVSTYSTLDNHPGKIGAPASRRKKKPAEAIPMPSTGPNPVITLKGKDRLPVDFLPRSKKSGEDKMKDEKDASDTKTELLKKKPRAQESKEEKKARKSAVKSERREARLVKKETKELYKSEAHRAQKVAAFTGPSSIHLM